MDSNGLFVSIRDICDLNLSVFSGTGSMDIHGFGGLKSLRYGETLHLQQ